jgi:nucleotide-binding universal stress UspA family protein
VFDLILVGVDGSDSARQALDWAGAQALLCHARLEVVSCAEVPWVGRQPVTVERVKEIEQQTAADIATALAAVRSAHPGVEVSGGTSEGRPGRALSDGGRRADLVVVGTGRDDADQHFRSGATARFVSRHSPGPVAVVPLSTASTAVDRLIVGVDGDGDRSDDAAVRWAADEAARRHIGLLVVHADPACGADARRVVERAVASAHEGRDIDVHHALVPADPATALLVEARPGDAIVVGRRHRTAAGAALFGTCTLALLRKSHVPIIVVDARR